MSGIPTNRTQVDLPLSVSSEILQKTQEASAVMQLARQIPLPGNGVQIPVITSDPTAEWVTETGKKPVSNPGLSRKIMQAHKLAVIVPFSEEFRRDASALYSALIQRLPNALAKKYDNTVFFGPGSVLANFDDLTGITAQALDGTNGAYLGLVAADTDISEQSGIVNGYAISPQGKGLLLSELDAQKRPIFIDSITENSVPRILGAPTYVRSAVYKAGDATNPDIIGFAGDWTHAMWGTVEGVKVSTSDQATLTVEGGGTINLWQQNMFAVRAEIEVGFVAEKNYFNALTRTHA